MRGGVGAAVDQTPAAPRLGGGHVTAGGCYTPAGTAPGHSSATATTPACEAGKPPPGMRRSKAATTAMPRASATSSSLPSRGSGGPAQAEVDHLGVVADGEVERLGEAEAVADGGARLAGGGRVLPAGPQRHQPRARRDAGDADAVACAGGDDAGDAGAVLFGAGAGWPATKSWLTLDLADAGRDGPPRPGCRSRATRTLRPVAIWCRSASRQSRAAGCGADRADRWAARRALRPIEAASARTRPRGLVREARGDVRRRAAARHGHDEAVDAHQRHRPVVDQRQAVAARQACRRRAAGRCAQRRRHSRRRSRRSGRTCSGGRRSITSTAGPRRPPPRRSRRGWRPCVRPASAMPTGGRQHRASATQRRGTRPRSWRGAVVDRLGQVTTAGRPAASPARAARSAGAACSTRRRPRVGPSTSRAWLACSAARDRRLAGVGAEHHQDVARRRSRARRAEGVIGRRRRRAVGQGADGHERRASRGRQRPAHPRRARTRQRAGMAGDWRAASRRRPARFRVVARGAGASPPSPVRRRAAGRRPPAPAAAPA